MRPIARVIPLVVLVTCMVLFAVRGLRLPAVTPPCRWTSAPVLCAEMPLDGRWFDAVLHAKENAPDDWAWSTWVDMPFLFAYGALLAGAALARKKHRRLALATAVMLAFASACDLGENVGILRALAGEPTDALAQWTRTCAVAKFSLAALGCALTCVLRASEAGRRGRVAWSLVAAVFAVGGFAFATPALVMPSFAVIVASCVIAGVETLRRRASTSIVR